MELDVGACVVMTRQFQVGWSNKYDCISFVCKML